MTFINQKHWEFFVVIIIIIIITVSWNFLHGGIEVDLSESNFYEKLKRTFGINTDIFENLRQKTTKLTRRINKIESDQKYQNKTISRTSKKKGIIMFWNSYYLTSTIGLDKVLTVHYDYGEYQCNVTRDRSYLTRSHVIVFNPRVSNGKLLSKRYFPEVAIRFWNFATRN